MPQPKAPLPVRLYGAAANLVAPLAYRRVSAKLSAQGTNPTRLPERMGRATLARPEGRLVWFHAASVGESLSVLRLIAQMGNTAQDMNFLVTSGTATSAQIVAKRLPDRTVHQFAPLDSRNNVMRFLGHWRPDAAVFVESELWPQMLRCTHHAGVPLALINARISESSARNWKRFPKTAQYLMSHFCMIHCQDTRTADHLTDLGLSQAASGVNLKSLAGPVPFDRREYHRMQDVIGPRPVWLAASTHPGEDEIVLTAHKQMIKSHPEALLILAPRHPERGGKVEALIAEMGFEAARRSLGMPVQNQTRVYLADTLGEMGLWYNLSPLTCLCGSFTDVGGHNPYEPAYAGSAVVHGPLYKNFSDTYASMLMHGASIEVADAKSLGSVLQRFLDTPEALDEMRAKTRAFADAQDDVLEAFAQKLSKALGLG
ncbi:MAG: 3-deoxy-D-manno-octulosonic acid transferase [Pseudomonadota bacterium]